MDLLFWVVRNRTDKNDEAPISCRITIKGQRKEIDTGLKCSLDKWNSESKRFIGKTEKSIIANKALLEMENKIQTIHLVLEQKDDLITSAIIKNLYQQNGNKKTIAELYKEFIEEELADKTDKTPLIKSFRVKQHNLNEYLQSIKNINFLLSDIDKKFAENMFLWLKSEKKHEKYYAAKQVQFLKRLVKYGIKKEYIKDSNIFSVDFLVHKPINRTFLNEVEIKKLVDLKLAHPTLEKVRDLFLMQCYSGLAYIDLYNFDFTMHTVFEFGHRIIKIQRQKTSEVTIVPIFNETEILLKKYNYKFEVITNQSYNRLLKEVQVLAGIKTKLHTHLGRKTAGNIWLQKGFSMEVVSKMLGHKDIRTTQKYYADVQSKRIVNEFKTYLESNQTL